MNPLATAMIEIWPYLLAFAVGALVPTRQGRLERFSLGLVALLCVAFVRGLWPGGTAEPAESGEWPHLLNLIVEGVKKEFKVDSVVIKRKPTSSRPATDEVLDALAKEADLVVSAMAD